MVESDFTIRKSNVAVDHLDMRRQRLHRSLSEGDALRAQYRSNTILGTFVIELPTPGTIRALALAGFDFVVLDLEHSPIDVDALSPLIAAAHAVGIPVLVRIWTLDAGLIGKVLDSGANGIMAPRIASLAQARVLVEAARYAPLGARGLCPLLAFQNLPVTQTELGNSILVVAQLEGIEALQACAEIAALEGIDAVFIGPFDLSQALGRPAEIDAPEVLAAARDVAARCRDAAMIGTYIHDPARSRFWAAEGFRFQVVGFDAQVLLRGAVSTMLEARRTT